MMKLKIVKIEDVGDTNERVIFEATAETDIGFYVVFRTRIVGHGVSNRLEESFWFPDRIMKVGEKVVLYTKVGTESTRIMGDGSNMYFYFWGLDKPLWGENDSVPLLMSVQAWDYYDYHKREVFIKRSSAKRELPE